MCFVFAPEQETMINNASLISNLFATEAWQEYATKLNKAEQTGKHIQCSIVNHVNAACVTIKPKITGM